MRSETVEVQQLWLTYFQERTLRTRNLLVEEYVPFANKVADRMFARNSKLMTRYESRSAGYLGLINAIEDFDARGDVHFCAYAYRRIIGAILDWLRITDKVPRKVRTGAKRYYAMYPHGSADRIEKRFVQQRKQAAQFAEAQYVPVTDLPDPGAHDPCSIAAKRDEIDRLIRYAAPLERRVLILLYCDGKTPVEVAQCLRIHPTRVSQLRTAGIARIRKSLFS